MTVSTLGLYTSLADLLSPPRCTKEGFPGKTIQSIADEARYVEQYGATQQLYRYSNICFQGESHPVLEHC